MKCPYCNNEMEEGYIQSNGAIIWCSHPHVGMASPMYDGDFYVKRSVWKVDGVRASFCEPCNIIIAIPHKEDVDKRIEKGKGCLI